MPAVFFVTLGLVFALASWLLPSTRVGDGAEYYAMYLAFVETLKPWMTAPAWSAYQELIEQKTIAGLVATADLQRMFPQLVVDGAADFNHFWFYSMLAAIVGFIPHVLGLTDPTIVFGALNGLLLAVPVTMAYRCFGWVGVASVFFIVFSSPVIWYINKAHTELFTVTMVMASIIAIMDRRIALSVMFLAISSTQNIPLAGPAMVLGGMYLINNGRSIDKRSFVYLVLAGVFVALHPAYYMARHGVITPQLLAGGADIGYGAEYFYAWLIDPDLGLFPNWPAGLFLIAIGAWVSRYREEFWRGDRLAIGVYIALFLVICLAAQSSTTNMNSGATPGPSRYGLWYVPLALPFVLAATRWALSTDSRVLALVWGALACASASLFFAPVKGETYDRPTALSYAIQRYAAALYEPPPEIYLERYSGLGERGAYPDLAAVIGPDCRRALINPSRGGEVANVYGCTLSAQDVSALKDVSMSASEPGFIRLR